ncbi:MAG: AmmeMemoRadiSam system radical SAM enzyme [Candidatus Gorgyraea atricola]|nr:AmmeMemoRadiSam system radical SAM enzyme [Candidatus Gorgyraea atricola]
MKKLNSDHEAMLYKKLSDDRVQCSLCPRRCVIAEGERGFCKVRENKKGTLYAISYGKAVHIAEELMETEAVFHFEPGSRILSLGNVGCNLSCLYCQNWRFSQIEHLDENVIFDYTPEQVVKTALEKGIKVLSWTYNDPVIWFEFVMDTARLAKKHGIINLFKSAMFINPEALEQLMDVIDIFSISVKSLNSEFYKEFTGGWIDPVLKAVKQVFDAGRHHIEISNLVVTGANDSEKDYLQFINWVKKDLSADIPIHFVRFHPNYKYTHVARPSIDTLEKAERLAKASGIKHCYLGNVFMHEGANTYCSHCSNLLVERRGLNADAVGLKASNSGYICSKCKSSTPIKMINIKEGTHEITKA